MSWDLMLCVCITSERGTSQVTDAIAEGFAAQQLLIQLQACLLADASISDLRKAGASEVLAGADKCLVDGADEMLQLLNVASQVQKVLHAAA